MLGHPEDEPAAPRQPDEMRPFDDERVEDGGGVPRPERHGVGRAAVRLLAPAEPAMVDEDAAELGGGQRAGKMRPTEVDDAVEEPAVQDDRRP